LRLILDVHHSPAIAERLVAEGHDVRAAAHDETLTILTDEELLRTATANEQAIVTENARDFDRIARALSPTTEHHGGLVFTSPRRFHRGSSTYPENVIRALRVLLDTPPDDATDWIHWLT
jgi:hypothetical protein